MSWYQTFCEKVEEPDVQGLLPQTAASFSKQNCKCLSEQKLWTNPHCSLSLNSTTFQWNAFPGISTSEITCLCFTVQLFSVKWLRTFPSYKWKGINPSTVEFFGDFFFLDSFILLYFSNILVSYSKNRQDMINCGRWLQCAVFQKGISHFRSSYSRKTKAKKKRSMHRIVCDHEPCSTHF